MKKPQKPPGLLICEDQEAPADKLRAECDSLGYDPILVVRRGSDVVPAWKTGKFSAMILDLHLEDAEDWNDGFDILEDLKFEHFGDGSPRKVFINSAHFSDETIIKAMMSVAPDRIMAFRKSLDASKLLRALADFKTTFFKAADHTYVNTSPQMRKIEASIPLMVASDLSILILGNTGDGKTRLANKIAAQMVKDANQIKLINCAAIPPDMFESELFGHKKGSFTSATADRLGKLLTVSGFKTEDLGKIGGQSPHEAKNKPKGVVILDEIATLPLHCQAKILSVLDGSPIEPLGYDGIGFLPNFRVIATTNETDNLGTKALFRPDLRHRLSGWVINMPPIHEQPDVIKDLIASHNALIRSPDDGSPEVVNVKWEPKAIDYVVESAGELEGGIRELKNVIGRAVVFAHFSRAKKVNLEIAKRAFAERLPTIAESDTKAADTTISKQAAGAIVTAIVAKLAEYNIDHNSIRKPGNAWLDYTEIGKLLPDAKREEFKKWVESDRITKKVRGSSDDPLLIAVSATDTAGRGTVYGNWLARNDKAKTKRQG